MNLSCRLHTIACTYSALLVRSGWLMSMHQLVAFKSRSIVQHNIYRYVELHINAIHFFFSFSCCSNASNALKFAGSSSSST